MQQKFKIAGLDFEITNFKALLVISILCFAVYGNIVFNDYSLNDTTVVSNNKFVKEGVAGIPEILTNSYQYVYNNSESLETDYRPLSEITLAIEYQFFGLNPHVSHFINILLYIVLSCLLYQLLLYFRLDKPYPFLPLLITCFFVVHTSHTEVVDSIKNREEIIALLFGLGSLLFAFRYYTNERGKLANLLGVICCILLSFLSKISTAPLIGVIILMAYQFGPPVPVRKSVLLLFPVAFIINYVFHRIGLPATVSLLSIIALVIYVYRDIRDVRYNVLLVYLLLICLEAYLAFQDSFGSRDAGNLENPLADKSDLAANLALALDSLWFYFKFMLFPYPNRFYYGTGSIALHQLTDFVPILSFVVHTTVFIYACYALWKRRLIGFIIMSYFICIFHYSNLFSKYTGIVSERALFVPGIWFITAVFMWVSDTVSKPRKKNEAMFISAYFWLPVVAIFSLFSIFTIQRNMQWKNYLTLYSSDIRKLQNAVVPNLMYADMLRTSALDEKNDTLRKEYIAESKEYYDHVISLSPQNASAYFGLGQLYRYAEGKVDSGCNCFQEAYRYDSTRTRQKFQVARCDFEHAHLAEARHLLADLFVQVPEDTFVLFYYARVLYLTGDTLSARRVNEILYKRNFSLIYFYVNEAYFNGVSGNIAASVAYFDKAMSLGYRDVGVFNFMLNYYLNTNQSKKANDLQKYMHKPA